MERHVTSTRIDPAPTVLGVLTRAAHRRARSRPVPPHWAATSTACAGIRIPTA
jgi:hypothetical protein